MVPWDSSSPSESYLEQCSSNIFWGTLDFADNQITGVVEYNVNPAEYFLGLGKGFGNVFRFSDVEFENEKFRWGVFGFEVVENLGFAKSGDSNVPFTEYVLYHSTPKPRRGTRYFESVSVSVLISRKNEGAYRTTLVEETCWKRRKGCSKAEKILEDIEQRLPPQSMLKIYYPQSFCAWDHRRIQGTQCGHPVTHFLWDSDLGSHQSLREKLAQPFIPRYSNHEMELLGSSLSWKLRYGYVTRWETTSNYTLVPIVPISKDSSQNHYSKVKEAPWAFMLSSSFITNEPYCYHAIL